MGEFTTLFGAEERHQVFIDALWALSPYAVLCGIAVFVSLPKTSWFFLLITFAIVAWIEIDITSANVSGSDMRGLGIVVDYFFQICVVTIGASLALLTKMVASLLCKPT